MKTKRIKNPRLEYAKKITERYIKIRDFTWNKSKSNDNNLERLKTDLAQLKFDSVFSNLSENNLLKINRLLIEIEEKNEICRELKSNIIVNIYDDNKYIIKLLLYEYLASNPDVFLSKTEIGIIPDSDFFWELMQLNEYIKRHIKEKDKSNLKNVNMEGSQLSYYPEDSIAEYKNVKAVFTGKGRAFLLYLNKNKNTPYTLEDIKLRCNPLILNKEKYFKSSKDIEDTIRYIKTKLKVNKGEFFPIYKKNNFWIWAQK